MSDRDVAALEERIDRLEAQNEALADENDRLEGELADYKERNERDKASIRRDVHDLVEVRTDDDEKEEGEDRSPTLEDVWIAGQPLGRIINSIQSKVNQEDDQSDESATRANSMTPMEQVIHAGEEGVVFDVTASVRRAKAIAEHFRQWAQKTPNGLVIKDELKTLVETATSERLFWKQIERAGHALEKLTKGAVQFTKTRRHGWMLVAEPAFVKQLGRVSSATGG
jgi:predicted RNase H-like nuclease (RuvC/YqgF family)